VPEFIKASAGEDGEICFPQLVAAHRRHPYLLDYLGVLLKDESSSQV
jgi:hypothetical protein